MGAAAVLLGAAVGWGRWLEGHGHPQYVGAVPFTGRWDFRFGPRSLAGLAVAVAAVALLPRAAARLRWGALLVAGWATTAAWAFALAYADGAGAIAAPLASRFEYFPDLAAVKALGVPGFLRTFTEALPAYSTHTRGHPPGFLLLLWLLDRIGLGGRGPAAVFVVVAGASATAAVAVAVRAVAGERAARRVLPFAAVLPAAVWLATSADAVYLAVSAWGLALLAVARHRGAAPAAAGGALLGLAALGSYGVVPLGVVAVALLARHTRQLAVAAATAAGLLAAVGLATGFWWPSGVLATRREWTAGFGANRSYGYWLVANLAVLAVMAGPAVVARVRPAGLAGLAGAALAAVLLADVTGVMRGEVERIWLPYVVWLAPAAAALPGPPHRGWLGAQVATGLAVQSVLVSKW